MKVVFFPGVGFHDEVPNVEKFFDKIKEQIDCEIEVFYWKHSYMDDSHGENHVLTTLPYKKIRSFFAEIILDFQHVLQYSDTMKLPEADIYLGHSAGSIIALQQDKPCILFGSPALLIESLQYSDYNKLGECLCKERDVLNVVHNKDIIGLPLSHEHVEDFIFKGCFLNPLSHSPIAAHRSYWNNKKVLKKVISTLKEWSDN